MCHPMLETQSEQNKANGRYGLQPPVIADVVCRAKPATNR